MAGPPCALPVCGWWAGLASAEVGGGGSGDFLGARSLSCHSEETLTRVASGGHPRGLATVPVAAQSQQNLSWRGPLAAGGGVVFRSCPSVGILA